MKIERFKREFKSRISVLLTRNIMLFRKPTYELYDMTTYETLATGRTLDAILAFEVAGVTVKQLIEALDEMPAIVYDGGRGSGSGSWVGGFPSGSGGGGRSTPDFPARFNSQDVRNYDKTLSLFRQMHANDDYESAISVDERGFTHRYMHGGTGSVSISATGRGQIIIHNHPSDGWPVFSKQDLVSSASSVNERGVVASSGLAGRGSNNTAKYAGDYTFIKGPKFDANGFIKAINKAQLRGNDPNHAADKWLRANQKKYGYSYSFKKATS